GRPGRLLHRDGDGSAGGELADGQRPARPLDSLALVPADADRQPDHRVDHLSGPPGTAPAAPGVDPAIDGMTIEALAAEEVTRHRAALVALLVDAVDSGASIGFLPPLGEAEAGAYWDGVGDAVRDGSRVALVARAAVAPRGARDARPGPLD